MKRFEIYQATLPIGTIEKCAVCNGYPALGFPASLCHLQKNRKQAIQSDCLFFLH
ncbi:MAG: hypothetical protein IKN81_06165 [Oscillospiraceae bacterium]|nr:hypothetical protein [Oscillospiraceae bacterium]